jgi:hypothetical protein
MPALATSTSSNSTPTSPNLTRSDMSAPSISITELSPPPQPKNNSAPPSFTRMRSRSSIGVAELEKDAQRSEEGPKRVAIEVDFIFSKCFSTNLLNCFFSQGIKYCKCSFTVIAISVNESTWRGEEKIVSFGIAR